MKNYELDHVLKARLPVTVLVILTAFALTYYITRSERDGVGYAPEQPIKYSHKLHAGQLGIDCKYCHVGVDKGRYASIPSASICMNCHTIARKDRPEIMKLVNYYENNKPIHWKRVHRVPDYAYFNHSTHVNKGIDCINCHEDVKKLEVMTQVHSFTMANCLKCHRQAHERMPELKDKIKLGPENCSTCHR